MLKTTCSGGWKNLAPNRTTHLNCRFMQCEKSTPIQTSFRTKASQISLYGRQPQLVLDGSLKTMTITMIRAGTPVIGGLGTITEGGLIMIGSGMEYRRTELNHQSFFF